MRSISDGGAASKVENGIMLVGGGRMCKIDSDYKVRNKTKVDLRFLPQDSPDYRWRPACGTTIYPEDFLYLCEECAVKWGYVW
jgi:hypothetical protein